MSTTFMPVVVSRRDPAYGQQHVLDVLFDDLAVGYSMGRPYGQRLMTWHDFDRLQLNRRELRRRAAGLLDASAERAQFHGQPPALMLSFEGIESSLILCDDFWDGLARSVPGQIVIGIPARDVVIVTGSRSATGIAKAARAVDRTLYAGAEHPLRQGLLVRGRGGWEPFAGSPGPAVNPAARPAVPAQRAPVPAARPPAGAGVRPVPGPRLAGEPPVPTPGGRPVPVQRAVSAPPSVVGVSGARPAPQEQRSVSAPPARRGWLAPAPRQAWSAGR